METSKQPWKVLIADDEDSVHLVTRLALTDFVVDERPIKLLSAYNETDIKNTLQEYPDIALILLDVVMDSMMSGLEITQYIRDVLGNKNIRIILRTGQSGLAPEDEVIVNYDINDYKDKTELTVSKLRTAVISSVRAYRDLIHIQENEKRLSEAQSFLSLVLNSMDWFVIAVDCKLRITLWNRFANAYYHLEEKQALTSPLIEVIPSLQIYEERFHQIISDRTPVILQYQVLDERFWDIAFYPMIQNEVVTGIVMRLVDVTDRKKTEDQLRQSQKLEAVGALSVGLAHDLNNILGGITGSVSLLEYEIDECQGPKDSLFDHLDMIKESADKASGIVKRLLSITRKSESRLKPVNIEAAIKNVLIVCESSLPKVIKIEKKNDLPSPWILGDQGQIEQVLLNLCINAAHAMTIMRSLEESPGGTLTIGVRLFEKDCRAHRKYTIPDGSDYLCLYVEDNGIGMNQDMVDHAFEPFYTTKDKEYGTGLGLAMVYNIVKNHDGYVDIVSHEGKGTRVELVFPIIDQQPDDIRKGDVVNLPVMHGTVLLADDEPVMRKVARGILEKCGFQVIAATDGVEALEIFKREQFRIVLVILDQQMPKLNGVEVFHKIHAINNQVSIVLTSGFGSTNEIQSLLDAGLAAFLPKPYDMSTLSGVIKDVL